jgi:plastocyanin
VKGIVRAVVVAISLLCLIAAFAGSAAGSGTSSIRMNDNGPNGGRFAPPEYEVNLQTGGPEATWRYAPYTKAPHDVIEDKGIFRSPGKEGIDSTFKVHLSAGSYPYYCSFHGAPGRGMHGTVGVAPLVKLLTPRTAKLTWAEKSSESGDRYDVDWRVKGGTWKHWKNDTRSLKATFGAGDQPVEVDPSEAYQVRVRSLDSKHPSRRSDWSPAASVKG